MPKQWVLGQLTAAKTLVAFEPVDANGGAAGTVIKTPVAGIHRCRVLPCTATGSDLSVFEIVLTTDSDGDEAASNWPILGSRVGTMWLKASSTSDAIEWAGAIDDAAAAAQDGKQGLDESWWRPPDEPCELPFTVSVPVPPGAKAGPHASLHDSRTTPQALSMLSTSSLASVFGNSETSHHLPLTLVPASRQNPPVTKSDRARPVSPGTRLATSPSHLPAGRRLSSSLGASLGRVPPFE
jgi:hypothetical protein